jgi:hypothetical protein
MRYGNLVKIGLRRNLQVGWENFYHMAICLVQINSVLTSLPMFMLSFFEIPKGYEKDWIFFSIVLLLAE